MIFEEICEIISEQTGKEASEIELTTNFRDDIDADSLDLFQIISDIEDKFDVKIENAETVLTVGDAVKLVEEQKK